MSINEFFPNQAPWFNHFPGQLGQLSINLYAENCLKKHKNPPHNI